MALFKRFVPPTNTLHHLSTEFPFYHPQPVLAIPGWRGALVRLFDLMPELSIRLAPRLLARGRRKQRRYLRRAKAGKLP